MSDFEREPQPREWDATDGHLRDALQLHNRVLMQDVWPKWIAGERDPSSMDGAVMLGGLQDSLSLGVTIAERMGVSPREACIVALEYRTKTSWHYLETMAEVSSAVAAQMPRFKVPKDLVDDRDPRGDILPSEYTATDLILSAVADLTKLLRETQNAQRNWSALPASEREKVLLGNYLNGFLYTLRVNFSRLVDDDFRVLGSE